MLNITSRIEGNKLVLEIDLSKSFGSSSSGKSLIVASTQGNVSVPGREDVKLGLNVYRPQSKKF